MGKPSAPMFLGFAFCKNLGVVISVLLYASGSIVSLTIHIIKKIIEKKCWD